MAPEPHADFSTAPGDKLLRPPVSDNKWGPQAINVAAQELEQDPMLNWMERLIRRRRDMPEVAFGEWSFIPFPDAAIFALRYDWGERTVLLLHNLGKRPCKSRCKPDGAESWGRLTNILGQGGFDLESDGGFSIDLPGHGVLWLRAHPQAGGGKAP